MPIKEHITVSDIRIDMVQIPDVINAIETFIAESRYGNYIVVSNAYDLVRNSKDERIKESVNNSNLTIPDGFSLIMLGRLHGYPLKKRVYGPDLMFEFLKLAEIKGYSNFFYGSTERTLKLLVNNLKQKFPRLNVASILSPP